jgi:hypothetical protein
MSDRSQATTLPKFRCGSTFQNLTRLPLQLTLLRRQSQPSSRQLPPPLWRPQVRKRTSRRKSGDIGSDSSRFGKARLLSGRLLALLLPPIPISLLASTSLVRTLSIPRLPTSQLVTFAYAVRLPSVCSSQADDLVVHRLRSSAAQVRQRRRIYHHLGAYATMSMSTRLPSGMPRPLARDIRSLSDLPATNL